MKTRIGAFRVVAMMVACLLADGAAWAVFDSAAAPTDSDLKVLRVVPEGNQVPAPGRQIVVTFDRPVVALGAMAVQSAQSPVSVSPEVSCQWHWLDPRSLACELNATQALAPATFGDRRAVDCWIRSRAQRRRAGERVFH